MPRQKALARGLSDKQQFVLDLMIKGRTIPQIVQVSGIPRTTLIDMEKVLHQRYQISSRGQLCAWWALCTVAAEKLPRYRTHPPSAEHIDLVINEVVHLFK